MPDRDDANRLPTLGQLIEDPVDANPKREQTAQPAAEHVTSGRFALEQAEGILDRIDQRPIEFE